MPTLNFTTNQTPHTGLLNSRVLIGRRLSHGVVVDDPTVSRLHAWIDPIANQNADWVISDAGSKMGTYVNDQRIGRQILHDGDVIRIGSVQVFFREADELMPGSTRVDLSSPTGVVQTSGILFDCHCGAPLWVGNDLAGKKGICRHCKEPVTVPRPAKQIIAAPAPMPVKSTVAPASASTKKTGKCGVCHAAIFDDEETVQCPDCAVTFHAECWQENLGCSSYGCPQVNALAGKVEQSKTISAEAESSEKQAGLPWGLILLALSVVSSILGALCFGAPALIALVISVVVLIRGTFPRRGLLIAAIIISIAGIPLGLAISDFWYLNAAHLPPALLRYF